MTDPAQMPGKEARPRSPKPPRWSAERRASRVMGRKAPRQAPGVRRHKRVHARLRRMIARFNGCRCTRTSLGAPPTLDWVSEAKMQKPGRKNAPRERRRLAV